MTLSAQAERDRRMQVYFAQARGPLRNGDLLRASTDRMLRIRASRSGSEVETMDDALIETLTAVADALEAEGADYAITGSVASSLHGEPFMSQDVDLLVRASPAQARRISARLTPRFYAPDDMLMEAAGKHTFANVVDNRTGLKADLSFVPPDGFIAEALQRKSRARIGSAPREYWVVSAEDVILMKLLWRKDTRSSKQWDNALSVARVQGARLDWNRLFTQARRLDLVADLETLRDEAGI